MVHRIYPAELQLNKANASDTEATFSDLNLSIHNDTVSTKIYDKRDNFGVFLLNVFGVGVSCRILYSFVGYLYVSGSGSITSVREEREIRFCYCSLVIIWFLLERFPLLLGAWDGLRYFILALPESSI